MAVSRLLKSCATPPGEATDRLELLGLGDVVLELQLFRRKEGGGTPSFDPAAREEPRPCRPAPRRGARSRSAARGRLSARTAALGTTSICHGWPANERVGSTGGRARPARRPGDSNNAAGGVRDPQLISIEHALAQAVSNELLTVEDAIHVADGPPVALDRKVPDDPRAGPERAPGSRSPPPAAALGLEKEPARLGVSPDVPAQGRSIGRLGNRQPDHAIGVDPVERQEAAEGGLDDLGTPDEIGVTRRAALRALARADSPTTVNRAAMKSASRGAACWAAPSVVSASVRRSPSRSPAQVATRTNATKSPLAHGMMALRTLAHLTMKRYEGDSVNAQPGATLGARRQERSTSRHYESIGAAVASGPSCGSGTAAHATSVSGMTPAKQCESRSEARSTGGPLRTLADASSMANATTLVAFSSASLGGRTSRDRPGTDAIRPRPRALGVSPPVT